MKKKVISAAAFFAAVMIALTAVIIFSDSGSSAEDENAMRIIELSETERLIASGRNEQASVQINALAEELRQSSTEQKNHIAVIAVCGVSVGVIVLTFAYIYYAVLRPFEKMQRFAGEIAKGNFDVPLDYDRSNYFGSFTWAFDSMRREVSKARSCEREAIENNKTVIATLSHDIKTPISSIRAYSEGLEANMDSTPEKRAKYLSVIMKKCDEVSRLTNDLFLHSLSDLEKLKINGKRMELCAFMKEAAAEIGAERGDVKLNCPDGEIYISADRNRMMQLCENLINNARKYAKTDIFITAGRKEGEAILNFSDNGKGIPDEDLPFIFDKFYRGHNCGSEQGSGLGLYIVKYIAESQNGRASVRNRPEGGLEIEIRLPAEE